MPGICSGGAGHLRRRSKLAKLLPKLLGEIERTVGTIVVEKCAIVSNEGSLLNGFAYRAPDALALGRDGDVYLSARFQLGERGNRSPCNKNRSPVAGSAAASLRLKLAALNQQC